MKPKKSSQKRTYLSKALSIHPADYDLLMERARSLGLNFSQYIVRCAKLDAQRKGPMVIEPQTGSEAQNKDRW